jgi:hypothetical protein
MLDLQVKPVVRYRVVAQGLIHVGHKATVVAVDHPSWLIDPEEVVHTSTVMAYNARTGDFETKNSIYKLAED